MITDAQLEENRFYFPNISLSIITNMFSDTNKNFKVESSEVKCLAIGINICNKQNDIVGLKKFLNTYISWANSKYYHVIANYPEEELQGYKKIILAAAMIDNNSFDIVKNRIDIVGDARLFLERNYLSQDNEDADLYMMDEQQKQYLDVLLSEPFFKKYYNSSYKDPARLLYDVAQIEDKKGFDAMIYYAVEMNLNAEDFLFRMSTESDYGRFLEPLIHRHGILPLGETTRNLKKHFDELKFKYIDEGKTNQYVSGILNANIKN